MGEYSEAIVLTAMVLGGTFVASRLIDAVAQFIARRRDLSLRERDTALEQRLARMESAIDAIAIEVERAGELQRFAARLQHDPSSVGPGSLARPLTPH